MTAAVAAPAPEDDDEELVLEHAACRCGRLADVVMAEIDGRVECFARCACNAFVPADAGAVSR